MVSMSPTLSRSRVLMWIWFSFSSFSYVLSAWTIPFRFTCLFNQRHHSCCPCKGRWVVVSDGESNYIINWFIFTGLLRWCPVVAPGLVVAGGFSILLNAVVSVRTLKRRLLWQWQDPPRRNVDFLSPLTPCNDNSFFLWTTFVAWWNQNQRENQNCSFFFYILIVQVHKSKMIMLDTSTHTHSSNNKK